MCTQQGGEMTRMLKHARPDPGMADDGDALNFCSTCAFSSACLSQGYDKACLLYTSRCV